MQYVVKLALIVFKKNVDKIFLTRICDNQPGDFHCRPYVYKVPNVFLKKDEAYFVYVTILCQDNSQYIVYRYN